MALTMSRGRKRRYCDVSFGVDEHVEPLQRESPYLLDSDTEGGFGGDWILSQDRIRRHLHSITSNIKEKTDRLRANPQPSPYVTGRMYTKDGMAQISGICLDSGTEGRCCISPSTVRAAKLNSYRLKQPSTIQGVGGIRLRITHYTKFKLTIAGKTIDIIADVEPKPAFSTGYSILLGMDELHQLGISMFFTTVPLTVYCRTKRGKRFRIPTHHCVDDGEVEWYDADSAEYVANLLDTSEVELEAIADGETEVSPVVRAMVVLLRAQKWKLPHELGDFIEI